MLPGAFLVALLAIAAAAPPSKAARWEIEPGPTTLSAEELAIVADPAAGAQHAVILVDETLRDESDPSYTKITYRQRAKVLSSEGRALATITLPFNHQTAQLKDWWARTICPGGAVLELPRKEIKEQEVIRVRRDAERVLRAALPGVEPGCIIDYGYRITVQGVDRFEYIPFQREWPVKLLRYRWNPDAGRAALYHMRRPVNTKLEVTKEENSLLFTGADLIPFKPEPLMPPYDIVRGGATLWYNWRPVPSDANVYWDSVALDQDEMFEKFLGKKPPIAAAIASLGIPPDATLDEKLRAAYDWTLLNIRNRSLLTAEQRAAAEEQDEVEQKEEKKKAYAFQRKWNSAGDLLDHRDGYRRQINRIFAALARELGAEVDFVLAPDRRLTYWDKVRRSEYQLSDSFLAVRGKGEPAGKWTLLDPGSAMAYGTIPWYLTATMGLRASAGKAHEIPLPYADARTNLLGAQVRLAIEGARGAASVTWSAAGLGQRMSDERLQLRRLAPHERSLELLDFCGHGGDLEITRAEAPGIDSPTASFALDCEGTLVNLPIDRGGSRFFLPIQGPWIAPIPSLTSASRTHPILLITR